MNEPSGFEFNFHTSATDATRFLFDPLDDITALEGVHCARLLIHAMQAIRLGHTAQWQTFVEAHGIGRHFRQIVESPAPVVEIPPPVITD